MRIAFLTPELSATYGWGRYALELAQALTAQGDQIVALTQRRADPHTIHDLPFPLADLRPVLPDLVPPCRGFMLRSIGALPHLRRAVHDCDVVHVIAEPYALLGYLAAGTRPLVITAHGTYVPQTVRRTGLGKLYRAVYQRARLIAVSTYTADQVRAALPGSAPTVIHNGVNVAHFQRPAPAPAKHGPTILASGGVKARKGTHLLVKALTQVRAIVPTAQLVVTGTLTEDAYTADLRTQIAECGLEQAVHLLGRIPDDELRGWYQHADVFALPALNVAGKFEGFGLVFLEASACGLPVIGTTGSGAAEAIRDGETGLLVPQNDSAALAEAIIRVLTDDALRKQMGVAGRAHAATQDWSHIAERVRALYH